MARIEINMEEYKTLKDYHSFAQREIAEKNKQIEVLKDKINKLKESLEEFTKSSLTERVFKWKNLVNQFGN